MKLPKFVEIEPDNALRPYVRRLIGTYVVGNQVAEATIAPTGYAYLGWIVAGETTAVVDGLAHARFGAGEVFIGGALRDENVSMSYSTNFMQVLVEFTATGLYELLGVRGEDVAGIALPLRALGVERIERLASLDSRNTKRGEEREDVQQVSDEVQDILRDLVGTACAASPCVTTAVAILERDDGMCKIADVTDQIGLSPSQLRKSFKKVVGLTPKTFARLLMLNRAMEQLLVEDGGSLTNLSIAAGFITRRTHRRSLPLRLTVLTEDGLGLPIHHESAY